MPLRDDDRSDIPDIPRILVNRAVRGKAAGMCDIHCRRARPAVLVLEPPHDLDARRVVRIEILQNERVYFWVKVQ